MVSEGESRDGFALGRVMGRWESDYDYGMGLLWRRLHCGNSPIEINQAQLIFFLGDFDRKQSRTRRRDVVKSQEEALYTRCTTRSCQEGERGVSFSLFLIFENLKGT